MHNAYHFQLNNMYFRKYEFPSEEYFDTLIQDIPLESNQAIVKLGKLATEELTIEELTAKKYCVDILWENEIPVDWTQYEIWDIEGNGSHTFLGWEFTKDTNSNSLFENHSKVLTKEQQQQQEEVLAKEAEQELAKEAEPTI